MGQSALRSKRWLGEVEITAGKAAHSKSFTKAGVVEG